MFDQIKPTVKIKADTPKGFRIINADAFDAKKHVKFTGVAPPPAPSVPPPPPPADPLANLDKNWRTKMKPAEIGKLAEIISGRTPENGAQAVEVIEAAIAARAAK